MKISLSDTDIDLTVQRIIAGGQLDTALCQCDKQDSTNYKMYFQGRRLYYNGRSSWKNRGAALRVLVAIISKYINIGGYLMQVSPSLNSYSSKWIEEWKRVERKLIQHLLDHGIVEIKQ
jgi:hypothetical protein